MRALSERRRLRPRSQTASRMWASQSKPKSRANARSPSNFQTHRAHQLDGIAFLHYTGTQLVVEMHLPVLDAIFKMHIQGLLTKHSCDFRERQVVRGDEPDGSPCDQRANQSFGADPAVMRIGALQELVDQE